jgi:hypothetical protein
VIYRVFPFQPGVPASEPGGPLHVPRQRQGAGRHDNPESYGALYVSRSEVSAIAERIQMFRGRILDDADLTFAGGARYAMATFDDRALERLIDLDDPGELSRRRLRPSRMATRDRTVTRAIAHRMYTEGATGFLWWSTLEASWPNVTLFAERARLQLVLLEDPEPLSVGHPLVRAAAAAIGVGIIR